MFLKHGEEAQEFFVGRSVPEHLGCWESNTTWDIFPGAYEGFLLYHKKMSGQVRSDQVRSGQVKSSQVKSG